jgi:hypothetical protein
MRKRLCQAVCENPADWIFAGFMLLCFVLAVNTLGDRDEREECVVDAVPVQR